MKLLALVILFVGLPILEFAILIEIGQRIGTLYTLMLVFGTGLLGAMLARMEGVRILFRIQTNMRAGVMPTEELVDGLLVLIAGIVLITPGFLTDIAGLILLFPPTRYPVKAFLRRTIRHWIATQTLRISI